MRFHLIDRIEEVCWGRHITAVKCVTLADDVFDEHFPGHPVFPGSLILEGLAQLGGSFFEMTFDREGGPVRRSVLAIVNRLKLRRPARPGDRLLMRAEIVSRREDWGVVVVRAEIDGQPCAEGELTFSFVDLEGGHLDASRRELYRICMREAREIP